MKKSIRRTRGLGKSQKKMEDGKEKEIRYFSMFTGVGGFELGLERASDNRHKTIGYKNLQKQKSDDKSRQAGFVCVGFSEIDKWCNQLLAKKFPGVRNYGDATKIDTVELPDFDLLCAGFPCQAFSIAGKRRGFEDTRGTLFFEIARIARAKRPPYLLLENVKGLLNHQKGQTFRVILETLSELGYGVQWMVLNSKFFGVPQNRERVFIVGSLGGGSRPEVLPLGETDEVDGKMEGQKKMKWLGRDIVFNVTKGSGKEQPIPEAKRVYETNGVSPPVKAHNINIDYISKSEKKDFRTFSERGIAPSLQARSDTHKIVRIQSSGREIARVYSKEGIAPTLHLKTGGWQEPKIAECLDANYHKGVSPSHFRKGRMRTMVMNTITEVVGTRQGSSKEFIRSCDNISLVVGKIRRLTPTECERLQGFPDGWTEFGIDENGNKVEMSDTQRYRMMGNAVTVNVIEAIGRRLLEWTA